MDILLEATIVSQQKMNFLMIMSSHNKIQKGEKKTLRKNKRW
jgi:hypothetical protein